MSDTTAIHYPLYPNENDKVSFYLNSHSGFLDVIGVKLSHLVSDYDINNKPIIDETQIIQLKEWSQTELSNVTHDNYYEANKYVTYFFEVTKSDSSSYTHKVSFSTRLSVLESLSIYDKLPVPVYITGDSNNSFNCIFIPHVNLKNKSITFEEMVYNALNKTFFSEPFIRKFRAGFNYYISTLEFDGDSETPPYNHPKISFADCKIIFHENETIHDQTSMGYSTAEYYYYGDIFHEVSHALYDLVDEYKDGSHFFLPIDEFPNNFKSKSIAENVERNYAISQSNINEVIPNALYTICEPNCTMKYAGKKMHNLGVACRMHILYRLITKLKLVLKIKLSTTTEDEVINYINYYILKFYPYDNKTQYFIALKYKYNQLDKKYDFIGKEKRPGKINYLEIPEGMYKDDIIPNLPNLMQVSYTNKKRRYFRLPNYMNKAFDKGNFEIYLPITDFRIENIAIKPNNNEMPLLNVDNAILNSILKF